MQTLTDYNVELKQEVQEMTDQQLNDLAKFTHAALTNALDIPHYPEEGLKEATQRLAIMRNEQMIRSCGKVNGPKPH